MDSATLQNKIYAGYAKAALRIGPVYTQYRPGGAGNPLAAPLATFNASFNAEDMKYGRPNKYGAPTWYGIFDGRLTQVGDYLVGPGETYFIAAQQLTLPILCVECNRTVRVTRPAAPVPISTAGGVSVLPYAGVCDSPGESVDVLGISPANNGGVFVGWPCSILFGKGRLKNTDALPSGTSEQTGWLILLPPSVPIIFQAGDRLIDDLGRMYVVNGAEQTDLGWRIAAIEVHA